MENFGNNFRPSTLDLQVTNINLQNFLLHTLYFDFFYANFSSFLTRSSLSLLIWVKETLHSNWLESIIQIPHHCVKSVQIRIFFWFVFSRIRTECGKIRSISPYSVQIRENADQNNSEYGQFSRSSKHSNQQNLEKRQIKELYK